MASPFLANVYLHYVSDLWVQQWRGRHSTGDMIVVHYADDTVVDFQHRQDAERFLSDLKERLAQFELRLHPKKTRLIEFGRYAAERRAERGEPTAEEPEISADLPGMSEHDQAIEQQLRRVPDDPSGLLRARIRQHYARLRATSPSR